MRMCGRLVRWTWTERWPLLTIVYLVALVAFALNLFWVSTMLGLLLLPKKFEVSGAPQLIGQLAIVVFFGLCAGYLCWKWLYPIAREYDDDARWIAAVPARLWQWCRSSRQGSAEGRDR